MRECNSTLKFKSIDDILSYMDDYISLKQSNTAKSIGILFESDGINCFYDSGTSKVVTIDLQTKNLLEMIINGDVLREEVIKESYIDEIAADKFVDFVNSEDLLKGFQINSLHCDSYLRYVHNSIQTGTTQIILELTEACNMRCIYCIYNENYEQNRNFSAKKMSKTTAFKAIDYLIENGDKKEISVTFYGGEPLIEFNLLREIIEYSKKVLSGRKINYSFTTNLTLLTKDMADYFSTVDNLTILCSIDGPKDIHDKYRIYADGSGTFDDVYKNFEILCMSCKSNPSITISANAVYTPPFSKDKPKKIDDFFRNVEFLEKTFNYQLGYPSPGSLPKKFLKEIPEGDMSLIEWKNEEIRDNVSLELFKEISTLSSLEKVHNRVITKSKSNIVPQNGCCVAGFRRLYVNVVGDFLPCERVGYSPILGNINTGIDLDVIYSKYIFEFSDVWSNYCNDCWSAKMCSSCFINKMDSNGVRKPDLEACEIVKFSNKRNLEIYHNILLNSPEKLEFLNFINTNRK